MQSMSSKVIPLRRLNDAAHERSDEMLLASCATGEMSALGVLFDRYHRAVYCFLDGLLGAFRSDIEDVVQATFLEVYRSAGRFHQRSQVKTWIFGIAVNVARHHTRHETRRGKWNASFAEQPSETPERPDEAAERRDKLRRLATALEKLPHDLRVVVVMCDIEGLKGGEVAQALDIPEGTVWRRLHDARKALRAGLAVQKEVAP
jgi:RNA polymerase sigma factor (sigma-70 family)